MIGINLECWFANQNDKEEHFSPYGDFAFKEGQNKKKIIANHLRLLMPLFKSIDIAINNTHIKVNSLPT